MVVYDLKEHNCHNPKYFLVVTDIVTYTTVFSK